MVDIIATTQVRVNKLYDEGGTRWAPKGGQVFRFPVDDDFLYHDDDYICNAIREVLDREYNNDLIHYEFLTFDIQFARDIKVLGLDAIEFGEAK